MKYIERYVSKLSETSATVHSQTSNSVYVVLDNLFKVRLSDHLPNDEGISQCNVCITSVYGSTGEQFIVVLGDTRIPMLMNRVEAEKYVKTTYTNFHVTKVSKAQKWLLQQANKLRAEEKKKREEAEKLAKEMEMLKPPTEPVPIEPTMMSYLQRVFAGNPNARTSWLWFETELCLNNVTAWKKISMDERAVFRHLFDAKKMNGEQIVLTVTNNQKVKWTKTEALKRGIRWSKGVVMKGCEEEQPVPAPIDTITDAEVPEAGDMSEIECDINQTEE